MDNNTENGGKMCSEHKTWICLVGIVAIVLIVLITTIASYNYLYDKMFVENGYTHQVLQGTIGPVWVKDCNCVTTEIKR